MQLQLGCMTSQQWHPIRSLPVHSGYLALGSQESESKIASASLSNASEENHRQSPRPWWSTLKETIERGRVVQDLCNRSIQTTPARASGTPT
ncbi:hypothetical protein P153DRAFT_184712 [Dothidotthia symphoricarpi CBS 119687]|uniref:Uncharacterized protein n=1 Tax=Dothidotthia symphoricarpi CBS 119687 TaxID=1392245 RepID=A0A6A6AML7_9PLEO|nr:uncharacterized protein P153DRAFT_184712 [Dothidotthia symphoricarpi CBS 119687]KAF2132127.1 hypothetical protein P153DRAFT_184712 [Dothidotthia symphoricarpi CBS 119687]